MKSGKLLFSWHHWCGLIVGLFLLVMSISGSILVFSDEIEGAYEKEYLPVETVEGVFSYDRSFKQVQQMYPEWEIRIYGKPSIDQAIVYNIRKSGKMKKIFAHPVTGRVIHTADNTQDQLHRQLLTLHYTMFAGTAGKVAVFIVGLLFLVTLVTGLYVYRNAIMKVLLFKVHLNRKTTRSFYSSLHRIIGVWSLVFNLLIVVTGLFISGNIALTALKSTTPKKATSGATITSVDSVYAAATNQFPGFNIYLLRVAANSDVVQLSGRFDQDPFYYGKYYSRLYYDGSTTALQKKEWLKNQGTFKKWQSFSGPLHFGNYGGLPVKILYSLLGLMPGFLSVSGFVVWRKRHRTNR